MERRVLGGTGISVSGFALGTMMLGAMGIPTMTSRSVSSIRPSMPVSTS